MCIEIKNVSKKNISTIKMKCFNDLDDIVSLGGFESMDTNMKADDDTNITSITDEDFIELENLLRFDKKRYDVVLEIMSRLNNTAYFKDLSIHQKLIAMMIITDYLSEFKTPVDILNMIGLIMASVIEWFGTYELKCRVLLGLINTHNINPYDLFYIYNSPIIYEKTYFPHVRNVSEYEVIDLWIVCMRAQVSLDDIEKAIKNKL